METAISPGRRARAATVAVVALDANVPRLVVASRSWTGRRLISDLPEVEVQASSPSFAKLFVVGCDNAEFARRVLAPRFQEWLIVSGGRFLFVLEGQHLLATTAPRGAGLGAFSLLEASDIPLLLEAVGAFAAGAAPAIWPGGGPGAPPTETPLPPDWPPPSHGPQVPTGAEPGAGAVTASGSGRSRSAPTSGDSSGPCGRRPRYPVPTGPNRLRTAGASTRRRVKRAFRSPGGSTLPFARRRGGESPRR